MAVILFKRTLSHTAKNLFVLLSFFKLRPAENNRIDLVKKKPSIMTQTTIESYLKESFSSK
jgi:hypothetical protein